MGKKRLTHTVIRKILLTAVLLMALSAAAQSPLEDGTLKLPRTVKDETVPPSPEAPTVIRPRANAVMYSRGLVTVSRELMSLRSGSLTLPVNISYTAIGVRCDDDGSLAGLGWTLECGGTVSRTVKGRPDEQRGIRVDAASKVSRCGDVSYLHDVLRGAVDADYDRYSYSVAGYSGSFIIKDGMVVQLPRTDVDIRLTGAEREGVRDFLIQTPSGERYLFGEREHTEYTYRPSTQTANASYISPDYRAVSGWHLTEAVSADGCDTVRISYTATRHEREEVTDRLYCVTMSHSSGGGYAGGDIPSGLYSVSRTAYPDKRIPSRVTGRGFELLVETDSAWGYRRISRMELRNAGGETVRTATLSASRHRDGRVRLDGYAIESDGRKTDGGEFLYTETGERYDRRDFFGYGNGGLAVPRVSESVLGPDLEPSASRAYDFMSAAAGILTGVRDFTGATTEFCYEPSQAESGGTTVHIGVRIKSIRVHDPVERHETVREFTYGNAATTIDFGILGSGDFLSTTGTVWRDLYSSGYSTGTSFTASCRVPGYGAEGAAVYYGKVTETLSGSGLVRPVKTEYEYDLSDIVHPYVGAGHPLPAGYSDDIRYAGSLAYSGKTGDAAQRELHILSGHPQTGYFEETAWEKAPLRKRTVYRHGDGGYTPETEETHYVSVDKDTPVVTGLYAEWLTRSARSGSTTEIRDVYDSVDDVNFFNTTVRAGRSYRDSTVIVHHYRDGMVRRMVRRYSYNGRGTMIDPVVQSRGVIPIEPDPVEPIGAAVMLGFSADSIRYDTGHGLLQAEQTEIGGITIDRYLCYASNITSGALHRMASEGRYALPVIERYVVNGTDTIDVRTGYSRYGVAANIQRSYEEIVHNGRVTTRRDYADYDRRGNLLETSVDGGSPVSYLWGYGRTLPVAAVIGTGYDGMVHITTKTAAALEGEKPQSRLAGIISALRSDAALHVTSYGYAPLVGCTSETNLDGTSVYYGYSAGRLSSVSDNSRRVLKTYACTMAGEGPGIDNMTSETEYRDASGTEYSVKAVYYDGLGQPVRQAHTDSSGSASATAITYDALGRKLAETVTAPVLSVSTYSDLKGLDTAASSYYMDGTVETAYAYGGSKYDNDITANGPGDLYAGMPRTRILSVNSGKEGLRGCVRLHIGADGRVRNTGLYAEGALTVEEVTDEDGRIGITFSDPLGCKVLERRSGDDGWLDTYYIHDNAGLLRAVLPPKVTIPAEGQAVSESDIERLAFRYRYDVRDRLSARKRPGCEWEHIAYDRTGRRLLVQDGNRRGRGRTGFELYDTLGRLCVSGECDAAGFDLGALNASGLRVTAVWKGGENELGGYEITAEGGTFSPTGISLTKVNYYDGYGFLGSCGMPAAVEAAYTGAAGFGMRHDDPCGKLTGSLTALYGTDGGASMLYSVNYYDDRGRIVEIHRSNADGKPCTERYAYGLTGDVLKHQTVYGYGAGGEDLFTYTYDASGRLASTGIGVDGGPVRMLEKRGYDPVGRLSHITSPGVDITCGYNIRGWVTGIDGGAAFRQKLYYAEESGQSLPLYSGDISRNEWTSHIIGDAGYSYFYDGAGRLAEARYSGDGHYSSAYCYDANGNLTGIFRSGTEVDGTETVVDDLTLTYSGNWLVSVSDRGEDTGSYGVMEFVDRSGSSEEYAYDAAGNLTRDLNKDIVDNRYNPINMPGEIRFADGSEISYVYDADGRKLRERYIDAEGRQIFRRDYDGSRVYRNGRLERIVTPCGYVIGGRIYTYVKDYQGNVRSVVRDDGEAVEATDYYPYGTPYSTARTVQPYKYGGKELNRMHGLDLYDSRARHYDPLLGRTTTMDSEAETTPWLSPYAWCAGNPIRFTDPTGKYVIGNDNKRVAFNKDTGQLSNNVNSTQLLIFSAMLKTKIGTMRLNDMIEAKYLINFRFEDTSFGEKYGETQTDISCENDIGEKDISRVTIVLFKKEIVGEMEEEIMYKNKGLTISEKIGAVATHEARHATDKKANVKFENVKEKREKLAKSDEQEYVNEILKTK